MATAALVDAAGLVDMTADLSVQGFSRARWPDGKQHAIAPFILVRVMALDAMPVQDRLDVTGEIEYWGLNGLLSPDRVLVASIW